MYKHFFSWLATVILTMGGQVSANTDASDALLDDLLDREIYRFSVARDSYTSQWVLRDKEVTVICIQGGLPILFDNSSHFKITSTGSQASFLPQASYLPGHSTSDLDIFLNRVKYQCENISDVRSLNNSLLNNRLIEYKILDSDTSNLNLQVSQLRKAYGDHLAVFSDRQLKHLFVPKDPLDRFVRSAWLDYSDNGTPMLLSVWERGEHGEQLLIHDLSQDKIIYHVISAGPITYTLSFEGLEIEVMEHTNTSDEIVEKMIFLTVDDFVKLGYE